MNGNHLSLPHPLHMGENYHSFPFCSWIPIFWNPFFDEICRQGTSFLIKQFHPETDQPMKKVITFSTWFSNIFCSFFAVEFQKTRCVCAHIMISFFHAPQQVHSQWSCKNKPASTHTVGDASLALFCRKSPKSFGLGGTLGFGKPLSFQIQQFLHSKP